MARGSSVHKLAEKYVRGALSTLGNDLFRFGAELGKLRANARYVETELQIGLDKSWGEADWFGAATWCRVVLDAVDSSDLECVRVIDYKTGRVKPDHKDQLSLYAIAAFARGRGNLRRVDALLWYLDEGEEISQTFVRKDLPSLKKRWERRVAPMLADREFKPAPSDQACRWCKFGEVCGRGNE